MNLKILYGHLNFALFIINFLWSWFLSIFFYYYWVFRRYRNRIWRCIKIQEGILRKLLLWVFRSWAFWRPNKSKRSGPQPLSTQFLFCMIVVAESEWQFESALLAPVETNSWSILNQSELGVYICRLGLGIA